jgi:hypothetical protein
MIGTGACPVCDFLAGAFLLLVCLAVSLFALRHCPPPHNTRAKPGDGDDELP